MNPSPHPSGLALSQFVDGDLPPARRGKIARHLERCDECRATVDFYRRLSSVAKKPRDIAVPDVAERVLRRRRELESSGDAVLVGDRSRVATNRRLALAASVAAALLIGGYLVLAPTATAHRSALRFDTSLPRSGDVVEVEYSPTSFLADADSLRLRIRARSAETPFPRQGVIGELRTATLHRNDAGRFEADLVVRPGDVYLAAAVEDFAGENVDTNLGRLWDVLVADSSGQPSTAALESKYRVLEPYNWVAASAWAGEAAQRYPENPFGWTLLYIHQTGAGSLPLSDSLAALHRQRLEELSAQAGDLTAEELGWLAFYATMQGDTFLEETLLARLADVEPDHPSVIDRRVERAMQECESDRRCLLARLEAISRDSARPTELLTRIGVSTAAAVGDSARLRTWLERAGQVPENRPASLARLLDRFDQAVAERVELRRARIAELANADDTDRPLRSTRREYRDQVATSLRSTRAELAVDLAIVGDTAGALEAFALAAESAWRPDILRPYVDLLIATGDTASAVPVVGLLLADPLFGETAGSTYATLPIVPELRSAQQAEYRRRVRDSAVPGGRLPARLSLPLLGGETLPAGELSGSPTVLFVWEPDLPRAADRLKEFDEVDPGLWARYDIRRLILTHAADPAMPVDGGPAVVLDPEYELSQHLGAYRLSSFVVLDPELRVVGQTVDAASAFRIASAFSTTAN